MTGARAPASELTRDPACVGLVLTADAALPCAAAVGGTLLFVTTSSLGLLLGNPLTRNSSSQYPVLNIPCHVNAFREVSIALILF